MSNRQLSAHIWRSIEAQARAVVESLEGSTAFGKKLSIHDDVQEINRIETKRTWAILKELEASQEQQAGE